MMPAKTTAPDPEPAPGDAARPAADTAPLSRQVACAVLWAELHRYAEAAVAQQAEWREDLTQALGAALASIPADHRIVLETERGMAVCFLSAPATATRTAAALLASGVSSRLCIGLGYGPVALVPAAGQMPRLIGDGVVVAERIAAFADAGQAVAERAFVDASGRAPQGAGGNFAALGGRTDTQLRTHELYALAPSSGPGVTPSAAAGAGHAGRWYAAAGAAALALVALLVAVLLSRGPGAPPPASARNEAPAAQPLPAPARTEPPPAVAPAGPDASRSEPAGPEATPPAAPEPASAATAPADEPAAPAKSGSPARAGAGENAAAGRQATIALAVSPWGEVLVNGTRIGVSPPLDRIAVRPGRVTVEIRNAGFAAYTETLQLGPGEEVQIRHKF